MQPHDERVGAWRLIVGVVVGGAVRGREGVLLEQVGTRGGVHPNGVDGKRGDLDAVARDGGTIGEPDVHRVGRPGVPAGDGAEVEGRGRVRVDRDLDVDHVALGDVGVGHRQLVRDGGHGEVGVGPVGGVLGLAHRERRGVHDVERGVEGERHGRDAAAPVVALHEAVVGSGDGTRRCAARLGSATRGGVGRGLLGRASGRQRRERGAPDERPPGHVGLPHVRPLSLSLVALFALEFVTRHLAATAAPVRGFARPLAWQRTNHRHSYITYVSDSPSQKRPNSM